MNIEQSRNEASRRDVNTRAPVGRAPLPRGLRVRTRYSTRAWRNWGTKGTLDADADVRSRLSVTSPKQGSEIKASADVEKPKGDVSSVLREVHRKFAERLELRLQEVRETHAELESSGWPREVTNALYRLCRVLAESAGTFGFSTVSDASRILERLLAQELSGGEVPTDGQRSTIENAIDHLAAAIRTGRQHNRSPLLGPIGGTSARSPLVFIVDENDEDSQYVASILGTSGYRTQRFPSHAEMMVQHSTSDPEQPDAIVVDSRFPESDANGADLTDEHRSTLGADVPIVVISERGDMQSRLTALRAGARRYCEKPVQPELLVEVLDAVTNRRPAEPYRVLVVDDDETDLGAFVATLSSAGMTVRSLSEPMRILDEVTGFQPDVLVLDIHTPEVTGPEVAAAIRADGGQSGIPILFLAQESDTSHTLKELDVAGDGFLVKPVEPEQLVSSVAARAHRNRVALGANLRITGGTNGRGHQEHQRSRSHNVPGMVYRANADSSIRAVVECEPICGYTATEIEAENPGWLEIVHPEDAAEMLALTARLAEQETTIVQEYRIVDKQGRERWVRDRKRSFLREDGAFGGVDGVVFDITEQKSFEEALVRRRDEAEKASSEKSEFVSRMSHELRTPLNAIIGFAQLLEYEHSDDDEMLDSLGEITNAGRFLLKLINDSLDISRVENGRIEFLLERVMLAPLVEESVQLVASMAAERRIKIDVKESDGACVLADRTRFKQALANLLSNAIKYNREGGSVTISCGSGATGLKTIAVTDSGEGIAADQMDGLFQPFNRMGAQHRGIEGTGIGLALAQRLVIAMGGSIHVQSSVGVGSTFTIELPDGAEIVMDGCPDRVDELSADRDACTPRQNGGRTRRVLYVEDNPANLKLVERVLVQRGGVNFSSAASGEAGLTIAQRHSPEVILLDINLPGMSGYEFLHAVKRDSALNDIPIVAITANAMPRDVERGRTAGFFSYLTKPLDVSALNRLLDRVFATV